ncbi:adhesin, partial [Staphylococcus aureus]|nr:adhesin [Staphylococcus aureus]
VKYTVEELTKVKVYTTHVDINDMGNLIVTNKYTTEKPNKPIYPEKPKDKTPQTKPDHSNKVKTTIPDETSKVDKDYKP